MFFFFCVCFSALGITCNIIKPKEVSKLHPMVNIHDLVGALHLPGDAVVSPPDVNHALAVAAARHGEITEALSASLFHINQHLKFGVHHPVVKSIAGVQIHERTTVNHVLVEKGHVKAVETDRGSIECEYFVNCAGQVGLPRNTVIRHHETIMLYSCFKFSVSLKRCPGIYSCPHTQFAGRCKSS